MKEDGGYVMNFLRKNANEFQSGYTGYYLKPATCPHCGEKIDPIEAMIKESEPTRSVETPKDDEPVPPPAQPAEKDSSGNKKR